MASYRKRDGKWQARVKRLGFAPIAKTFNNKTDAEKWAHSIEVQIERGAFQDPRHAPQAQGGTIKEIIERYLLTVTPTKRNARCERYTLLRWSQQDFANSKLPELAPSTLAKWRDQQLASGVAPGTIRNALAALSAVIRHAVFEWGYDDLQNPVMRIKRPAPGRPRTRRIQEGEIQAIKQATKSIWLPPIMDMAIETAMRQGEIAQLTWNHIDLKACTAHLPKTKNGESRNVPLSTCAVELLRRLRGNVVFKLDGRVFDLTPHAIAIAFQRAVRRARKHYVDECKKHSRDPSPSFLVNLRFHDLRHEGTSRLVERGLSTVEVSAITGHKTLQMLKRYTHLKAEDLAKKLG
jgi:integrase